MENKKENKVQSITLQAYDIENDEIGKAHSDLMEKLSAKLSNQKGKAGVRRMILDKETQEEDLLSDYVTAARYVYGVMWRIAPTKEVPSIPDGLFDHEKIQISEIQDKDNNLLLVCKDHYSFALNKHFLVTNFPKSRIKSLQVYLNWLLEATRGGKLYKFTEKIEAPKGTALSEIKNIVFTDPTPSKKNKKTEKEEENSLKVYNFATDRIMSLVEEIPNLKQMLEKKILSARLVVNFTKPKAMEEEEYKRELGTLMKPINDSDGIKFKLKNGKTIKGSEILLTKVVEVEKLESGRISEQGLIQEMELFLLELNQRK